MSAPSPTTDVDRARQVLRDAITAAGVPEFTAMALLAAAEGLAKTKAAATLAEFISSRCKPATLGPN